MAVVLQCQGKLNIYSQARGMKGKTQETPSRRQSGEKRPVMQSGGPDAHLPIMIERRSLAGKAPPTFPDSAGPSLRLSPSWNSHLAQGSELVSFTVPCAV